LGSATSLEGQASSLHEADARHVSQDVLLKLVRATRAFRCNPTLRLRRWLSTVAHHACWDVARCRRVVAGGVGSN